MENYKYKNPSEDGYVKLKVSKHTLSKFSLGRFKTSPFGKYEVYYNPAENRYQIHKFYNNWYIVINVLLFPVNLLYAGFSNLEDLIWEYKRMFHQKEYGSFSSERFCKGKYSEWDEWVENHLSATKDCDLGGEKY